MRIRLVQDGGAPEVAQGLGPDGGRGSIADVGDALPAWGEILGTLTFRAGYNTNVVLIGTMLLGVAAGVVGVFALLRKRSLMSDALSHATLPGIALAFIIVTALGGDARSLPVLLIGATVTGAIGVLCVQWILRSSRLREDAAIGIVLSVFFGAGIVALSYIQNNPGGNAAGLNKFIYGQTAAMSAGDAWLMGGIAVGAVLAAVLLLKELTLVCFNDAFARVDGWPVSAIDLLMMALVVLVTVSGLQAVGLILVVAMLIIPAATARFWTDRLWVLVLLAAVIGGLSGYLGSAVSALLPRKPAGAVIVLTSGCIFTVSLVCAPARGVVAVWLRRALLRIRIEGEHVLEAAFEGAGEGPARLDAGELDAVARLRGWSWWFRSLVMLNLRRRGQARASDGGVELTEAGRLRGSQVSRNHRLWEQYLVSYADIAPSHVDWSVDMVEHVLSEALVAELEATLARKNGGAPAGAPAETGARA